MRFRELAFGLAAMALLVLAGCVSLQGDLSAQQRVYAMQSEFDVLLGEVEAYAALPECTDAMITACHEPDVVAELAAAAVEADMALDTSEAIVRDPLADQSEVTIYVTAARAALNRIATLLVEEGR